MFKFSNIISENVWKDRYSKNGEDLNSNFDRVAKFCSANNQEDYIMFKEILEDALFVPAGRTMSNAGIGKDLTLNNCFVAPQIQDSMDDIFTKVKLGAITHQRGGGIGYDFSQLRPKGSPTSNDAFASGPISFIDVFNQQTVTITQGGRRGANMGVLSVYHMDIESFITCKAEDSSKLPFFNLSVMVDDDFMKAKNNDENIWLHHPVYDDEGKILKDESKWKFKKKISAKYLWDLITKNAYDNGEPGVFFYDNMNKDNNLHYIERVVCSNPCAEYLAGTVYGTNPKNGKKLNPWDFGGACNLGSLLLHNFILNPFTGKATVDYAKLKDTINTAVKLLDNIIDINNYPDKIFQNYQKNFRTIGLGITGFADMLTMLNLKYGSEESLKFADDLMNFITKNVYKASIQLAKEKGAFPLLDKEKFVQSGFIQKHIKIDPEWKDISDNILKYGIRNAKMLSVAPTGTLSLTFGNNCSSGLEPIFSLSYERRVKIGGQDESNVQIVQMQDYAYGIWKELKTNNIVNHDIFVTALDLPVSAHLEMLKVINFHVDMSSSKTINIPADYSFEDTKSVYDYAWENGIKGCTIFRPNDVRKGVLIDPKESKDNKDSNVKEMKEMKEAKTNEEYIDYKSQLKRGDILSTDDTLLGRKKKLITGCGSLHLTAFFDPVDGEFQELFLQKGSDGGCNNFMIALSRMTSLCARAGVDIYSIVDQLKSCGVCPSYAVRKATKGDTSIGSCCPVAVGNAILELYKEVQEDLEYDEEEELIDSLYDDDFEEIKETNTNNCKKENDDIHYALATTVESKDDKKEETSKPKLAKCPECGEEGMIFEGGCCICKNCGYSKCG